MMQSTFTTDLTHALEDTEAAYWGKYYHRKSPMKSFASHIAGAFATALPQQDVLALNRVIGLGLRSAVDQQNIRDIIHFYRMAGSKRFFVQISPYALQPDLRNLLVENGFRHHNNWSKLIKTGSDNLPETNTGLAVTEIGPDQAGAFGKIIFESFDWKDEDLMAWLAFPVGLAGYRHFIASYQGKAIAAAAMHISGVYASMAFAGTLPSFRGMGAQSLLLKTRIVEAAKAGCSTFISETAENKPGKPVTSYRNMRKIGFELAYQRENWIYEFEQ